MLLLQTRYRQFMQCDIDILGEPSNLAEIELILATTSLLGKLDFNNFTIRINDRRFLKAMAAYSGFEEKDYDSVFITLDKMDKIGLDGVAAEMKENGYAEESVEKYLQLFKEITGDVEGVRACKEKLQGFLPEDAADSLEMIITSVESAKEADFRMLFDPTLVRTREGRPMTAPRHCPRMVAHSGSPPGNFRMAAEICLSS